MIQDSLRTPRTDDVCSHYVSACEGGTQACRSRSCQAPELESEPRSADSVRSIVQNSSVYRHVPPLSDHTLGTLRLPLSREGHSPSSTLASSLPQSGPSSNSTSSPPKTAPWNIPALHPGVFPQRVAGCGKRPWPSVSLTAVSKRHGSLSVLLQLVPQCLAQSSCSINIYC